MISHLIVLFVGASVIGHGLMLLLSIAKWHNLLNSQSPVYDGDRQAPSDLSNLLPKGTDLDPDTWLMHHELMLAFLRRIANASNIQPKHIYKILQILVMNGFPPNVCIIRSLRYLEEKTGVGKAQTRKDTIVSTTSHRILRDAHSISQW